MTDHERRAVLLGRGADEGVATELLDRSKGRRWWPRESISIGSLPLPDEPFIEAWTAYAAESDRWGAWGTLADRLVQLRFPVREGISSDPTYRAATLKGEPPVSDQSLELVNPDGLVLTVHPSLGGGIPVILVGERADFETLVRALTARNEPVRVPPAMGACLVNGLNNWDRIRTLEERWRTTPPAARSTATWREELRRIIARPELYKDRLILLSRGPYSGVDGEHVGVAPADWLELSHRIRLEHECIHVLTLRLFGALRHDVQEELVADWVALHRALGGFRSDLAMRFLGLEGFPDYRPGGRLEVYRGSPSMSDRAFAVVQRLTAEAIATLASLSTCGSFDIGRDDVLGRLAVTLLTLSLEEMAGDEAVDRVRARFEHLEECLARG